MRKNSINRKMSNKAWYIHFFKMCVADFLLFVSLFMLYPALPKVMFSRLNVPAEGMMVFFVLYSLAMFLVGPILGKLIDAYKRKYVCILTAMAMLVTNWELICVQSYSQLLIIGVLQGIFFGIVSTEAITLAIDVSPSYYRNMGNLVFAWVSWLGMLVGVVFGVYILSIESFNILLYISVTVGLAGLLLVAGVYVPFRAPEGVPLFSIDRFLLPKGWLPAINLIFIALVPGLFIPLLSIQIDILSIRILFFTVMTVGFIISICFYWIIREKYQILIQIGGGLCSMVLGMGLMLRFDDTSSLLAAFFIGLGLGLIVPMYLLMLVQLSGHCRRGTANTTYLLFWQMGIAAGIALSCYLNFDKIRIIEIAMISAVVSLAVFLSMTYPYYREKRIRWN